MRCDMYWMLSLRRGSARQPSCWSAIFFQRRLPPLPGLQDGPEQDVYKHLDHQFLSLVEKQERMVMATVSRSRGLNS